MGPFWAVAQLVPGRTQFALAMLTRAGFQPYCPLLREWRTGRRGQQQREVALFPGYTFLVIQLQWHAARWAPGTLGLIMNGIQPARVPDNVIDDIRRREVRGAIELPKPAEFRPGDPVRILSGAFEGHLALYAGMKPHERIEVLLSFLGSQQRVTLPRDAVAAPTDGAT
jgi:transcription antitermination factor NusG